ncbi:MAG: PSP1 domain-containing protein [Bacteroidetes bacterium]|nr:MAG: PSP1 domain-containing protein [Bacteroidota bacterium]
MACGGCSSGRGCSTTTSGSPAGCRNNGSCGTGGCNKLNVFDWLANMELPAGQQPFDCVEIRFKNSRKEFFRNHSGGSLAVGDVVAVEASPGHDIGTVSLTGELVRLQMKRRNVPVASPEIKKVYRKARQADVDKWIEAQQQEQQTMIKSRQIASGLNLQMKISDVEVQGDKTKAIFYYTAEERVDFRELIKKLAEEFRVRIEMRQIGARQEAGRLGGIGSCGRELCCSSWLTDFRSVTTGAARYQQLSLNPLKLAGQCGKLKCCLNYELDAYVDALKDIPETTELETVKGKARHQKTDIFRRLMFYTFFDEPDNFIPVPAKRVHEIIEMNKRGEKPETLVEKAAATEIAPRKEPDYENVVGQDSLTRFDSQKKKKRKKGRGGNNKPQGQQQGGQQAQQGNKGGQQQQQKGGQQQNRQNQPNKQQGQGNRNNNRRNPQNKPKQNDHLRQQRRPPQSPNQGGNTPKQ